MSHAESILFWTYVALGPVAWALLGLAMQAGHRRMRRLQRPPAPLPDNPPRVTVLIPAKDEGERVRVCLDSVLAQDYPNFAVITVDDRSSDNTGAILDEIAEQSSGKVRSLHVTPGTLPQGWLGKCHALHFGTRDRGSNAKSDGAGPRGDWLLLVDSDVRLEPDALRATMALSLARNYDAVSMMTALECHTFLEKLVLPLAAGAWSVMNTISITNVNSRPAAYANGQFFLIRRSMYDAVGGHESVRDQITEDVELARLMKRQGASVRLFLGSAFASTRMHATLPQMLRGWGRIYSGTSRRRPWRILAVASFLLVCGFSGYAALIGSFASRGSQLWLIASVIHLLLMTLVLGMIYAESGNQRRNALLFPLGGGILLAILAFAIRWCITGRIEWRGTVFQQPDRSSPLPR